MGFLLEQDKLCGKNYKKDALNKEGWSKPRPDRRTMQRIQFIDFCFVCGAVKCSIDRASQQYFSHFLSHVIQPNKFYGIEKRK